MPFESSVSGTLLIFFYQKCLLECFNSETLKIEIIQLSR